jgi:hypothetical protein
MSFIKALCSDKRYNLLKVSVAKYKSLEKVKVKTITGKLLMVA